ncbi:Acg family FMN-binding oxidoreductase [Streptomyces sp. BH097]|uniref:Acg family FMN-binding oxidoreductase n=1 Tax=unclassified Streptomyces TaxID=2593676 RepID=UPI003BB7592D
MSRTKDLRYGTARHAAHHVVRAAVSAPSLHNSQPWLFTYDASGVDLFADPARHVRLADPSGRELVVSCGAALFNLRVAMRQLGFRPAVHPYPSPCKPEHLARVSWGAHDRASPAENRMYRALRKRHTHRGPFPLPQIPQQLVDELREHARAEGADMHVMESKQQRARIADLVRAGEAAQRGDPAHRAELVRWTQEFNGSRLDGVPLAACSYHPDCVTLAGRDFVGLTSALPRAPEVWPARTGLVAVLTTRHDSRLDWLRAGQALQRVLLHATDHDAAVAFHTQPLEFPRLRSQVRAAILFGEFPQMILRIGRAVPDVPTPRRPATEVLRGR